MKKLSELQKIALRDLRGDLRLALVSGALNAESLKLLHDSGPDLLAAIDKVLVEAEMAEVEEAEAKKQKE